MSCTLIGLAVETLPLHRLPLVQARVPGGFPSPAEDYLEGTLKLLQGTMLSAFALLSRVTRHDMLLRKR